jgi:hypothetical protein
MKKIFSTDWKYGIKCLYFSTIVSLLIIAYYNINSGIVISSDSKTYSEWADILIKLNFNLYNYYSQNTFINPNYIYTIPVLLIAILKVIFGTEWQIAFFYVNLVLLIFSIIIFSKSLQLLKVRPLIISFAMPILTLSVDLLTWPRYILTDVMFSFLVLLLIFIMIKDIVNKQQSYLYILLMIILIYLTRPTSLPFIFAIVSFIGLNKLKYSKRFILTSFLTLIIFMPFLFAIIFKFMTTYLSDVPQVLFLIEMVNAGMVIHDRPETWIGAPSSFFDLAYLYFVRFIFFFNPYAESFSLIHIILNILQTLLILFSICLFSFSKEKIETMNKSVILILIISLYVAFFHSFTLIDYDWRYRFPIIVPLIMIFPISFEIILIKLSYKN